MSAAGRIRVAVCRRLDDMRAKVNNEDLAGLGAAFDQCKTVADVSRLLEERNAYCDDGDLYKAVIFDVTAELAATQIEARNTKKAAQQNTLTRLRDVLEEATACGLLDDVSGNCKSPDTVNDFCE